MDTDKILARMAAMESELAQYRAARKPDNDPDRVSLKEFREALARNPKAALAGIGAQTDYITKVLVADALGDQAPHELRVLAQQGPLVAQTQTLTTQLEAMRQRLESMEAEKKREGVKALASDKSKYPHLAKALAADPDLFKAEFDRGESAEELEARLARISKIVSPPASTEDAVDSQHVPSTEGKQAQVVTHAVGVDPTPPQLPRRSAGPITVDEDRALKEEIERKYAPKAPPQ